MAKRDSIQFESTALPVSTHSLINFDSLQTHRTKELGSLSIESSPVAVTTHTCSPREG